jgi:hypothetical protein
MPCGYVRTMTALRIWCQVAHSAAQWSWPLSMYAIELCSSLSFSGSHLQICAEVSEAPKFDYPRWNILNAPLSLQVLSEAPENALAVCESTLLTSRGVWERLEVLRRTGEVARSVWEDCVWLSDLITFC